MAWPTVGASSGATPTTSISRDSSWAAAEPTNRSRITASATTAAAALKNPCSTRSPVSVSMFGVTEHSSEMATCREMPMTSGSRRPNRSENGPMTSCPMPAPTSVPDNVSWTAAWLVWRSASTVGSDGRYMSVVRAGSAARAPSMRMYLTLRGALLVLWTGDGSVTRHT